MQMNWFFLSALKFINLTPAVLFFGVWQVMDFMLNVLTHLAS